jgi:uncharacterized membrane protein
MTALLIAVGALAIFIGCFTGFAGMMSDDPVQANSVSRNGCLLALAGIAMLIAAFFV